MGTPSASAFAFADGVAAAGDGHDVDEPEPSDRVDVVRPDEAGAHDAHPDPFHQEPPEAVIRTVIIYQEGPGIRASAGSSDAFRRPLLKACRTALGDPVKNHRRSLYSGREVAHGPVTGSGVVGGLRGAHGCGAVSAFRQPRQPRHPQGRTNTVFVTATEENGAPVVDLVADDFTIKEDGKDRDVLKVELARVPMQIAVIVDDNGSGIFRSGLVNFVQQLQGRAEMSLSSVMGQTHKLVEYTTNAQKLVDAVVQLSARPAIPDGGQLLEGIFQAARDQEKREASRPVIVAVTVGGEEHSTLPAHHVLDQLAKSRSCALRDLGRELRHPPDARDRQALDYCSKKT